ncbi:MAG: hypothetical protein ABSE92_04185 [Terriglobales bacterium]|jgi:hypothetical protein
MILLVTQLGKSAECAGAIQQGTNKPAQTSSSLRAATAQLRDEECEYELVVIEQSLAEAEPEDLDALLQHLGGAMPLFVNFAICGLDRLVREVRASLHRRQREIEFARRSVEDLLRSELRSTVTALLLSCEMALQVHGLPPAAELKLHTVDELAKTMKQKLDPR